MTNERAPRLVYPFVVVLLAVLMAPTARVQSQTFTLTIHIASPNVPALSGAVGVVPPGLVCNRQGGNSCSYQIAAGTSLRLAANQPAPSTPGVFSGGTGPAAGCATSTCNFVLDGDAEITATFDSNAPKTILNIHLDGEGEVGADNNRCQNYDHNPSQLPTQFSACAVAYAPHSEVKLQESAQVGGRFAGWAHGTNNAAACGGASPCTFILSANTSITASFTPLTSIAVSPAAITKNVNQGQNYTANGSYANGSVAALHPGHLGTWRTKASMQFARYDLAAAVADAKFYAIGGTTESGPSGKVERFDPGTNSWVERASLVPARGGLGAATVDDKIYVAGGSVAGACPTNAFERYHPDTDQWELLLPMPGGPRRFLEAAAVGNRIYVLGGEENPCFASMGTLLDRVEVYDVTAGQWSTAANMPTPRRFFGVGVVNGIIYVVGGFGPSGPLSSVDAYDPATNSWTSKAPLPSARELLTVATIEGRLYALGGSNNGYQNTVFVYDPVTNTWANKAFIPSVIAPPEIPGSNNNEVMGTRSEAAAAAIGGTMYLAGGLVAPGGPHVPFLHAFGDNLIWSSSNSAVATITPFGFATTKSFGTTTVGARSGTQTCADQGGTCGTLTVAPPPNSPPTVTIFGTSPFFTQVGGNLSLSGNFRDPDVSQSWTATVNFGDGTGDQPLPYTPGSNPPQSPNGNFMANHSYMAPGNYTATVTVRDNGTPQGVGSASVQVVVEGGGGGGGEEGCARVSLNIQGADLPFNEVMVTVFANGEEQGSFPVPVGLNEFDVQPATYRLVFDAPDGYVVAPPELEFTIACEETVSLTVQVQPEAPPDTTPPVIAKAKPNPFILWPPNNRMVNVSIDVRVTDDQDASPSCGVQSVSSNEPVSAQGDWIFSPDSLSLQLRAARKNRIARIYTITVRCRDDAGNAATRQTYVIVLPNLGHLTRELRELWKDDD